MLDIERKTLGPGHYSVLVIGGGQAGLSMSAELKSEGIGHVLLEKHRRGHNWREFRWDSFCLVTPNWQCQLPGFDYVRDFGGTDPHGFMQREEILDYFDAFVRKVAPPLMEGVGVEKLSRAPSGQFSAETTEGLFTADQVVVAVGGYHRENIPRIAMRLPPRLKQIHSSLYKSPGQFPPGAVLVIGTGQSGCQIAEDLHLSGRKVHLCVGSAPRAPRVYRGRDAVDWLADMGYYEMPVEDHPKGDGVRAQANHYLTGRDGGREIDLRRFALEGMALHGRLKEIEGEVLSFRDDLAKNLDEADAVYNGIRATIDRHIAATRIDAPVDAPYVPSWRPSGPSAPVDCAVEQISAVVWATGFASDYRWMDVPAFDGKGYPGHVRGVSPVSGLYFLGLPWQHTWGSGRFSGVARDARHLKQHIVHWRGAAPSFPVAARSKIPA